MSLLSCPRVANDGCLIRQCFTSRRFVQDSMGVLVGCTVGQYGGGLRSTGVSSRITYDRTQSWLINHNKMTIRSRFRTPDALNAGTVIVVAKFPLASNDNQFLFQFNPNLLPVLSISASAADVANYAYIAGLSTSTEYVLHWVYDGTLAAGSRVIGYVNGLAVATTIGGVIPTSLRAGARPVTVLNLDSGVASAPATTFVLRDFAIWNRAFSASECLTDALDTTYALGGP